MSTKPKSIYKAAAESGAQLGVALIVMFLCAAYSMNTPGLSLIAMAIFMSVPVAMFFWLRRHHKASGATMTFSALWLEGICVFFFGCLLMSMAMFVYMRYIQPDFIVNELETASRFYSSMGGEMSQVSDVIDKMIATGTYPTPIQISIQMIWLGVFSGSLLSMVVAFIVKKTTH